jgi:hypothetical protein
MFCKNFAGSASEKESKKAGLMRLFVTDLMQTQI